MPRKTVGRIEPGMPQVLHDMRRAYLHETPGRDEPKRIQQLREMKQKEPAKFHSLMEKYEDRWEKTKFGMKKAERGEDAAETDGDECVALVEKLIKEHLEKTT